MTSFTTLRARALAACGALLLCTSPAQGLDTMTAGQLADACLSSEQDAGASCLAYVRGFIDGALATDPRVTMNVERALAREESFSERAFRTRLGSRMDRYGPSFFADFCIPTPVPLQDIVTSLVTDLGKVDDRAEPAREFLYRHLRQNYPCAIPED